MKHLSISLVIPLVVLAVLLTLGTRKGTSWSNNVESPEKSWGQIERFLQITPSDFEWIESYSGEWKRYGLELNPGTKGYVRFKVNRLHKTDLLMRVWAYDYGSCRIQWWPAHEDPGSARILSSRGSVVGRGFRIQLPPEAEGIMIEVSGENRTSGPQLLLDKVSVSSSFYSPIKGWSIAWWIWGVITISWWWLAAKRKWWHPSGGIALWSVAVIVVLLGGSIRLNLLSFLNGVPLDPDVVMYRTFADRLDWFNPENGFYSASFGEREPLWIALLKLWQFWVGDGDFAVRLLTSLFSTAVIALTGVFLWRWLREPLWVIAGMLMVSLNPSLIEESCRGLRSEVMSLGFIIFLMLSLPVGDRLFRPVKTGIMVGVWALLRSPALGIAFGMWGVLWFMSVIFKYRNIRPWLPPGYSLKRILLAVVIALCLFLPHLYGFQERHGDWRWPSYGYARWNANMEFPERLGTPDFPTVAEFKESPYAGPRISYAKYLFGLHTPLQIAGYQLLGWLESLAYQALSISTSAKPLVIQLTERRVRGIEYLVGPSMVFAFVLGVITPVAWFRLIIDRNLWWAPPMLLWGTSYVAFLYHVRLVEPMRHTLHVYPLLVLVAVWGLRWLCKSAPALRLSHYVRNRRF